MLQHRRLDRRDARERYRALKDQDAPAPETVSAITEISRTNTSCSLAFRALSMARQFASWPLRTWPCTFCPSFVRRSWTTRRFSSVRSRDRLSIIFGCQIGVGPADHLRRGRQPQASHSVPSSARSGLAQLITIQYYLIISSWPGCRLCLWRKSLLVWNA